MPKKAEYVPAEPFADWLNNRLAAILAKDQKELKDAAIMLAVECGWGAASDHGVRKLYRLRKRLVSSSRNGRKGDVQTDRFPRDVVEDALFNASVPFEEVYPEIAAAEEVVLEPEDWCPECDEPRTPIDGLCPFCEWQLGPSTGQQLLGSRLEDAA